MATIEQVEKLREKAASGGDLLEAIIYLEKKGKIPAPEGGGYYNGGETHKSEESQSGTGSASAGDNGCPAGESFGELCRKFIRFCGKVLHKGNINSFEVYKGDECKARLPLTLLALLLIFAFWLALPLIILGLFFGLRYRFSGPDFKKDTANHVMDAAADTAEDIKKSFKNAK